MTGDGGKSEIISAVVVPNVGVVPCPAVLIGSDLKRGGSQLLFWA